MTSHTHSHKCDGVPYGGRHAHRWSEYHDKPPTHQIVTDSSEASSSTNQPNHISGEKKEREDKRILEEGLARLCRKKTHHHCNPSGSGLLYQEPTPLPHGSSIARTNAMMSRLFCCALHLFCCAVHLFCCAVHKLVEQGNWYSKTQARTIVTLCVITCDVVFATTPSSIPQRQAELVSWARCPPENITGTPGRSTRD